MFYAWLIIITVLSFLIAFCCVYAMTIWIRRRRYTKERFAFAALTSITVLTTALFAAIAGQSMPWHLTVATANWAFGEDFEVATPTFADYILLVFVYIAALGTINSMFQRWDGLRSERQHDIEQRRETMSIFLEGLKELERIIQRRDPLPIFKPSAHTLNSQLEGPSGSVAWRDRAHELVRLKWSCYAFSDDTGWHEKARCWVGRNLNTNDLVLLRCAPETIGDIEMQAFIDYAERLKADRGERNMELILAIESQDAAAVSEWSGTPIHFETEATLLNDLVDWTDYRNDIRKRMSVNRLPDSNFAISEVFVQPRFSTVGWDLDGPDELEGYVENWLEEPGQRQFSLLGDYGQGKSTAALALVHKLLEQDNPLRIPILIELRGTSPRNLTPLQLLGAWSSKYNINPKALLHLHMAGRLLLIFEGFDEMALVGDAEMRLKHFKTLWGFCYPRAKILITGRPNFFFDKGEMIASLGISEPVTGKPYCRPIRLKEFDIGQVKHALRNHEQKMRDEICGFAEQNVQFEELISRPSLLHIVSVLWDRENLSSKLDQLTSAYVMKLFIRHSYRRQGLKESDSPEFMALTSEEREYFMKGVATYMASHGLPNQITGTLLNEAITGLVDSMPDAVSLRSPAISGEVRRPLKERIADSEHGLEHVQTDVRTCGILVDDPAAPGAFRFGHKSFMEYLFAEVLADQIVHYESPDAPSILTACGASARDITFLPVSIGFLSELLGTNIEGEGRSMLSQKQLAKRILRLLVGTGPFDYVLGRYRLYFQSLTASSESLPLIGRSFVVPLLDPLPGILVFLSLFPSLVLIRLLGGSMEGVALIGTTSALTICSTVFWLYTLRIHRVYLIRDRLRGEVGRYSMQTVWSVWNLLCKQLGFDDRVLFQIAGISWLPWTRDRAFDFFIESNAEE